MNPVIRLQLYDDSTSSGSKVLPSQKLRQTVRSVADVGVPVIRCGLQEQTRQNGEENKLKSESHLNVCNTVFDHNFVVATFFQLVDEAKLECLLGHSIPETLLHHLVIPELLVIQLALQALEIRQCDVPENLLSPRRLVFVSLHGFVVLEPVGLESEVRRAKNGRNFTFDLVDLGVVDRSDGFPHEKREIARARCVVDRLGDLVVAQIGDVRPEVTLSEQNAEDAILDVATDVGMFARLVDGHCQL